MIVDDHHACKHLHRVYQIWTNSRMLLNYKNACTEFYLEIQYLLTLTEKLQSHFFTVTETRNSDKWDSARCYSEFHWISLNFKNILQFMNLLNFERPGADFSIYACLYSLSNTHQANFTKIQQNNKIGTQWKLYIIIFSHDKIWTAVENAARLWQKWSLTASAVSWTFHRMQSLFTVLKLAKIATWVAYSKSAHAEQTQRYTVKQGAYYCNKKIVMLLTVILIIISFPSPTHSHSRLKSFLFCKSFPLQPFLFFFRTDYMDSPDFYCYF